MVTSSLHLACSPASAQDVYDRLCRIEGVQIAQAMEHRVSFVLQTVSSQVATAILADIRTWPGVSGVERSAP